MIMHSGRQLSRDSKKSRAEPYAAVSKEHADSRRDSAFRTDKSSSTTATRGSAFGIRYVSAKRCILAIGHWAISPRANIPARPGLHSWRQPGALGEADEFRDTAETQLGHHASAMNFDCLLHDAEFGSNLFVQQAGQDTA